MTIEKITVPDFGDVQEITVLELYVAVGDRINIEDPLIALESEKAVMDIPSPVAGIITEIHVKTGDTVASGDLIALLDTQSEAEQPTVKTAAVPVEPLPPSDSAAEPGRGTAATAPTEQPQEQTTKHASPSIRAFAREQGVSLDRLNGSGPKGRILKEDIVAAATQQQTGRQRQEASSAGKISVAEETVEQPLNRIQRISGPHLQRSWQVIPHVTHFDEADITELEAFRKQLNESSGQQDVKLSPLVFVIKAAVTALREFPLFNSSLAPGEEAVIIRKYYHLGIAVDTPGGLVVPVVKHADLLGLRDIARELGRLSNAAREGKLAIPDIQGATFTISSLGGIGGTGFTPIVNAPQVAILGLSRSYHKPVWNGQTFVPRLTLPFSLSYDHRVIDGAEAARFCRYLARIIEDLRRALL